MKRPRAAWSAVALIAASTLVLSACSGGGSGSSTGGGGLADCGQNPLTCNSADNLQQGGQLAFAIEKNIENWNVTTSEGNVFESAMALKGVLPYTFVTLPDLNVGLNKDMLVSAEQTSTDPQTIVYKIKTEAAWDDGTPISADDFVFNWKVQNGKDCPDCEPALTTGYDQLASVVGSDGGKTVTATFAKPYTDWQNLWSSGAPLYPAHIGAKQGDVNTPAGLKAATDYFAATVPNYTGGPYKVEKWDPNVALTTVPNPKWYGATKPKLDRVIFRVITDATQEPTALQNNEVQVIYPQPQVDLVQQVQNIPGVQQTQGLGLTWEHFDFNMTNPFLAAKPLREALYTAVNRQEIIDKTVGQFNKDVKPLNSHGFVSNQPGFEDTAGGSGQGSGDIEKAKKILTDAGYKGVGTALVAPDGQAVPPLRIRYTVGNAIRQSQCELFAQYAKQLGVTVTIQPTDALGKTLSSTDFDVIVYAFVSSPFPFANAQQSFVTSQGGNYGKYSNPEVDRLLNEAAASTNVDEARKKLNDADKLIWADAFMLPLYQKPTFIALRNNVGNVRNNSSLDGPPYNVLEWGLRPS